MRHGLGPLLGVRQLHELIFDILFDSLNLKSLGKKLGDPNPIRDLLLDVPNKHVPSREQDAAKEETAASQRL